eukprot:7956915-Pyramimonas_sp.AAC.1
MQPVEQWRAVVETSRIAARRSAHSAQSKRALVCSSGVDGAPEGIAGGPADSLASPSTALTGTPPHPS